MPLINLISIFPETLADRTDALTKRPLDFDREEHTRKKETNKWLDSHFGSESTSKDSRDESISDIVVEPTKKTFFNVTIKSSNNNQLVTNNNSSDSSLNGQTPLNNAQQLRQTLSPTVQPLNIISSDNELYTNKLASPSKVYVPEREITSYTIEKQTTPTKTKYFQGISDWSERKENTKPLKTPSSSTLFPSKAFKDELNGTLESKQRLLKQETTQSHNVKYIPPSSVTPTRSYNVTRDYHRSGSREDLLRSQKEDLGYLSGSRTDLRYRKNSDDYIVNGKRSSNGYLHREDSGFVRDSKEDIRYHSPPQREDSFREEVKPPSIQRDDSAYVSSSTYFTTPRSPRRPRSPIIKTPDSGIRSPTPPNELDDDRPTVPQRKKAMERKIRATSHNQDYANYPAKPRRDPPIDYSPPPRSRSISPIESGRKSHQKTRFSTPPTSTASMPRSIQTQTLPQKKKTVGNAIGNSLRKLVGKIRSASAERKLKIKPSSKRSPSPLAVKHKSTSNLSSSTSTYQQYNIIDGHINGHDYNYTNGSHPNNKQRSNSITSQQGKQHLTYSLINTYAFR